MSEAPSADPVNGAASVAPAVDKRAWAESVLKDVLRLLDIRARLELKDAPDNGIAVAVFPDGELPQLQSGKRSSLVEALQFLANKIVNRPNSERRWISIGIGAFPEPRPPPGERPPRQAAAAPSAPASQNANVTGGSRSGPPPSRSPAAPGPTAKLAPRAPPTAEFDELKAKVPPDGDLAALGRRLSEKAAQFGRHFAVVAMSANDRANLLQGAQATTGLSVRAEGEGRNRRAVFTPDKPVPMPKRALPQDDDDDFEE